MSVGERMMDEWYSSPFSHDAASQTRKDTSHFSINYYTEYYSLRNINILLFSIVRKYCIISATACVILVDLNPLSKSKHVVKAVAT